MRKGHQSIPTAGRLYGPELSASHNERKVSPTPVIKCMRCKGRLAMALFAVTEQIFGNERNHSMLLCGECGFTILETRRMVESKDGNLFSVAKYSSCKIIKLLSDFGQSPTNNQPND